MELCNVIRKAKRYRDIRGICNKLMPLARRATPLTSDERNTLINIRGVYRTLASHRNRDLVDAIIDGLLSKK